uniref:Gasdermin Eb n=1 Tax=Callorhinchus milii TaxID=7868 RepID=A0A4W3HFN7_CALMI
MFATATNSFVKQIDKGGDLIPVRSLNDSDKLQLLSLATKRKMRWFWQKPKYHSSSFNLEDILTGDVHIKPAVKESNFLKYEGIFENSVGGAMNTLIADISFHIEGQNSIALESSFGKLRKQEVDLHQVLKISQERTINMRHSLVQQTRERGDEVLCVVNEKIITTQQCFISEHLQIAEKCGGMFGLKIKMLKVSANNDGSLSKEIVLEIPPQTVIAYSVKELHLKTNGQFELCLLSDKCGGFDKAEWDKGKEAYVSTACSALDCVDASTQKHGSRHHTDEKNVCSETSLSALKQDIEEAKQQLQPFEALSEGKCQQLFRLYSELLYQGEAICLLETILNELSLGEQPNLSGLHELEPTQVQNVKELLQFLGYSTDKEHLKKTKEIATQELFTTVFYFISALDDMSDACRTVLGICCEMQVIPTLWHLINNLSDDGTLPIDSPVILVQQKKNGSILEF